MSEKMENTHSVIERFLNDQKEVAEHNMLVDLKEMIYPQFANREQFVSHASGRLKHTLIFTTLYLPLKDP